MFDQGIRASPNDAENGIPEYMAFEDTTIRRTFIRKVYLILALQLLSTLGFVCICIYSDEFYDYVEENPYLLLIAIIVLFVTMIILGCCSSFRRKAPMNFICLGIFTFAQSFLLAVTAAKYDSNAILLSIGLTAVICVALSIYAMQTKWDFTLLGGFLLVSLIVGIVFGLVMIFFYSYVMMMIYCSLGVILYSLLFIYDTQLIVGGHHTYSIAPDEYVFAALNLYIDIIQIFVCLLHILGTDN